MFVSTCTQNRIILAGDVLNDDIKQIQKLIQNMPGGVHQEGMLSIIDKAGFQISSWKVGWRCIVFDFEKMPWISWSKTGLQHGYSGLSAGSNYIMGCILQVLRNSGWELIARSNLTGKIVKTKQTSYCLDTDEWFLIRVF